MSESEKHSPSHRFFSFLEKKRAACEEMVLDWIIELAERMRQVYGDGPSDDEVLRRTSNSSFPQSNLSQPSESKSKLLDSGEDKKPTLRPNRSIQRSGLLGKSLAIDDDPFGDSPMDYKSTETSTRAVVEVMGFVLAVSALICSLSIPRFARPAFWGLHIWRWSVLIIVITSGSLLSGSLFRIIVFFLERNCNLCTKRLLYFVYGVRKMVHNCIWLGLILLAWIFLFNTEVVGETKALSYVTKILFCFIVATILRLVKTLILKVLAFSYHVSTYFDRIKVALFNQSIIKTLSGPPFLEIQQNMKERERIANEVQMLLNGGVPIPRVLMVAATMLPKNKRAMRISDGIIPKGMQIRSHQIEKSVNLSADCWKDLSKQRLQHNERITIGQVHMLNQKNISAWNINRLLRIVSHGTLTIFNEQTMRDMEESESTVQIMSDHDAKVASKKIFINVAKSDKENICLIDLKRFMSEDEAIKTMCFLGGAQDARISETVFKCWVVDAFTHRRDLSFALNTTKTIMNKLHQIANILVGIIAIVICLLILNIGTTQFFMFLSSQILLAEFVFGHTFKTMFEAMIFLFVMHPFDVNYHCEVDGTMMIVEQMNLLTTTFVRFDNSTITYPNSALSTLPIVTLNQRSHMIAKVEFCVPVSTPSKKIALMEEKITEFIKSTGHWSSDPEVCIWDVDSMNMLKISICMWHQIIFEEMRMNFMRRELVVEQLSKVLKELDMDHRLLPMDDSQKVVLRPLAVVSFQPSHPVAYSTDFHLIREDKC